MATTGRAELRAREPAEPHREPAEARRVERPGEVEGLDRRELEGGPAGTPPDPADTRTTADSLERRAGRSGPMVAAD